LHGAHELRECVEVVGLHQRVGEAQVREGGNEPVLLRLLFDLLVAVLRVGLERVLAGVV
jgi:hypothetical protein